VVQAWTLAQRYGVVFDVITLTARARPAPRPKTGPATDTGPEDTAMPGVQHYRIVL
jgi:hypothetical protein